MSSLWTPGGEHPVGRDSSTDPGQPAPSGDPSLADEIAAALPDGVTLDDLTDEERARAEQMVTEMAEARERLIATPASTIVANHAMGLYELAALHLSQAEPDFGQATVAIDALAAIVQGLEGRLGESEATLREALSQLRMAFVELRKTGGGDGGQAEPGDQGGDSGGESGTSD